VIDDGQTPNFFLSVPHRHFLFVHLQPRAGAHEIHEKSATAPMTRSSRNGHLRDYDQGFTDAGCNCLTLTLRLHDVTGFPQEPRLPCPQRGCGG
jgi:hypothetical protein